MNEAEIAANSTILRGVVGSTVHGTNVEGTDDRDEMGVCIEPPEYVIGNRTFEQHIKRDRAEGVRSEPGDLDLTIYSLRKWVRLALKGNPSVLLLLYTPQLVVNTNLGQELRDLAPEFASKRSADSFLGFIRQQKERLMGERGQLRVNRPELVERYGFDTKYAGHILRLAYQGVEYLSTGKITLPMPGLQRQNVLDVRNGKWSLERTLTKAGELIQEIEDLKETSPLPGQPNEIVIEKWMVGAYFRGWAGLYIPWELPGQNYPRFYGVDWAQDVDYTTRTN